MQFTIDLVSNCDPSNLLVNNKVARDVVRQQAKQAAKKCCSFFACLCCCVDNPSSSELIRNIEKLGIPPKELVSSEKGNFIVISCIKENADGVKEKIPLVFCGNPDVVKTLLKELNAIYVESSQMSVLSGASLDELDAQAAIWNKIFGLPNKSRGTQQLDFNANFRSGDPFAGFAKAYQANVAKAPIHSLVEEEKPTVQSKRK